MGVTEYSSTAKGEKEPVRYSVVGQDNIARTVFVEASSRVSPPAACAISERVVA